MIPSRIGPYKIVRLIGSGGMGAVYEALNPTIERSVALKVLRPEYVRNQDVTSRFLNEARAVNRIKHPGIVQISDSGSTPEGMIYLVMELLEGQSLSARLLSRGSALPAPEAMRLGRQIAGALAAAHSKGIVHRDIKPDRVGPTSGLPVSADFAAISVETRRELKPERGSRAAHAQRAGGTPPGFARWLSRPVPEAASLWK